MSNKIETTEHKQRNTAKHKKKSSVLPFLRGLIVVLLVAIAALLAVLYLAKAGLIFRGTESGETLLTPLSTEKPTEPVVYTVSCITPLDEPLTVSAREGETVTLPDAPEIEGYVFLGWKDSAGETVKENSFVLTSDLDFSAVYVPAFRDAKTETVHTAFLSVDEDAYFHPDEPLTRAETAVILYSLLDNALTGCDEAEAASEEEISSRAAAVLTELGIDVGQSSAAEEPIGLGELFRVLSALFPPCEETYSFEFVSASDPLYGAFCLAMEKGWITDAAVSPDQVLTRRDAARIFNRLVGRTGNAETDYAKVGTILDVSFDDPDFPDIAEAVIPHEAAWDEGGEQWSSSEALPLRKEGLYFVGTKLHCIDANGGPVINASYGNFDFGPDGVITTGMPELDVLVQEKLVQLQLDPATMDREVMLRTIYNDVTYHNAYLMARKNELHEIGDISWVNDAAYRMLTVKKGCCYNFSAEFYVLAKAIGFDAVIYSGTINPPPHIREHGWVEIEFDGVPYIFDTELEYTQVINGHTGTVYYKISYERVKGWYYNRGEQT